MIQDTTEEIEAPEESEEPSDEDILALARERFTEAEEGWHEIIQAAEEDLKFLSGEQWDAADVASRKEDGRPTLTFNKLPGFARQVKNDQRQNKQGAKVSPVDDKADVETAKVLTGMIRHIEYDSNASVAYDRAFGSAVDAGFGFLRLTTEFESPLSFNQVLKIGSVKNRFACRIDPSFQEPDGSDAEYGFAFADVPHAQFKKMYPNAKCSDQRNWELVGTEDEWFNKTNKTVRVCDYYSREWRKAMICQLSNGETIEKSKITFEDFQAMLANGVEVVQERETLIPEVIHRKIVGNEVLEKTVWPGSAIPIFIVLGDEQDINGKRILESLIRHSKDAQRMYNYHKSAEAEVLTTAPKAPWIIAFEQVEGFEKFWKAANRRTQSYLPYKAASTANGAPLPPPQRNVAEPPIQAMSQAALMASDDIKATLSMFDASIGNQSNETSGVAIRSRAAQAQTSNFHFSDNLSITKRHLYKQMIEIIPKLYDVARVGRAIGEDGVEKIFQINPDLDRAFLKDGDVEQVNFNLGKYDVTVSDGPSFETRRQEAAAGLLELAKANPQVMAIAPDLIVKAMDFHMAEELAERFKKTLPPGIIDDPNAQALPPQAKAQLDQMGMMIEQLTQQLNDAQSKLETKKLELDSKERITAMQLETQAAIKLAELESKEAIELLFQQVRELDARSKQQALYLQKENQGFEADQQVADGGIAEPDVQPAPAGGPQMPASME